LAADQIGRQSRKSIGLTLRPPILDRHILSRDEACFVEAILETGRRGSKRLRRTAAEKTDHRHDRLLSARDKRPCSRHNSNRSDEITTPHTVLRANAEDRAKRQKLPHPTDRPRCRYHVGRMRPALMPKVGRGYQHRGHGINRPVRAGTAAFGSNPLRSWARVRERGKSAQPAKRQAPTHRWRTGRRGTNRAPVQKHTGDGAAVPVAKPRCLRVQSRSSAQSRTVLLATDGNTVTPRRQRPAARPRQVLPPRPAASRSPQSTGASVRQPARRGRSARADSA